MEKDIHVSHKEQGTATNREKGQGITQTRRALRPVKTGQREHCFLPSFGSFGQAVSEEKIFRNRLIRNKNCLWRPCLSMDWDEMSNLYRGPSIDASCQVLVHFAKRKSYFSFNRFFINQPIRNKNCLYRSCSLTDRDKMSNLYRGPSIDASYQVSDHLDKQFQRRRFLEIDQSETVMAGVGHVCHWIGMK